MKSNDRAFPQWFTENSNITDQTVKVCLVFTKINRSCQHFITNLNDQLHVQTSRLINTEIGTSINC
jgi:hypothetical protein